MGSFFSAVKKETSPEIPRIIYGTAWKGENTATLTYEALRCGYRGIDTAAQPENYREDLVGVGIRRAISEGIVNRSDIYIQTKFTPPCGQGKGLWPYDATASITAQVYQSCQSSLKNLSTDDNIPIDCLVLHCHLRSFEETLDAWKAMEQLVPHNVRTLGISNIDAGNLAMLYEAVTLKPAVVQNPFYEGNKLDKDVRSFCTSHHISYQAFWVIKKNAHLLQSENLCNEAQTVDVSVELKLLYFVSQLENSTVLVGSSNLVHLKENIEGFRRLSKWYTSEEGSSAWLASEYQFRELIRV
ncbi:hypothetical protein B7463_g5474, partial [Scytalidium lignicola]